MQRIKKNTIKGRMFILCNFRNISFLERKLLSAIYKLVQKVPLSGIWNSYFRLLRYIRHFPGRLRPIDENGMRHLLWSTSWLPLQNEHLLESI